MIKQENGGKNRLSKRLRKTFFGRTVDVHWIIRNRQLTSVHTHDGLGERTEMRRSGELSVESLAPLQCQRNQHQSRTSARWNVFVSLTRRSVRRKSGRTVWPMRLNPEVFGSIWPVGCGSRLPTLATLRGQHFLQRLIRPCTARLSQFSQAETNRLVNWLRLFIPSKSFYPFLIESIAMMDLFLLPNFDCDSIEASLVMSSLVWKLYRQTGELLRDCERDFSEQLRRIRLVSADCESSQTQSFSLGHMIISGLIDIIQTPSAFRISTIRSLFNPTGSNIFLNFSFFDQMFLLNYFWLISWERQYVIIA